MLHPLHRLVKAYELDIKIENKEFFGPKPEPGYVEKKWGSVENWKKGEAVVYLNDNNFEHLTQAASGWTTGDWFVMFGAAWCEHCKSMEANWNQTAIDLFGEVNVAYVDAANNPFTAQRFNITLYPTLLMLHKGRAYEYKGPRYWKNMIVFARIGYEEVSSTEILPAHGTFDEIVLRVQKWSGEVYELYEQAPMIFFGAILFGILFGCMLPYGYILSARLDPTFVQVQKPKDTTFGPKVWDGTSAPGDVNRPTLQSTDVREEGLPQTGKEEDITLQDKQSIRQVEVDAETVEIVTNTSSQNKVSRKAKGKKKN